MSHEVLALPFAPGASLTVYTTRHIFEGSVQLLDPQVLILLSNGGNFKYRIKRKDIIAVMWDIRAVDELMLQP